MRRILNLLTNTKQIRFATVGALNTFVDLGIYALLRPALGFFFANLISTTTGMIIGYLLHRSYTFKAEEKRNKREAILFFCLTILGLWILQPIIIYFVTTPVVNITGMITHNLQLLLPKCVAICFGLVWNYLCYNYIVFKNRSPTDAV
jgi:putative flippase GtrA